MSTGTELHIEELKNELVKRIHTKNRAQNRIAAIHNELVTLGAEVRGVKFAHMGVCPRCHFSQSLNAFKTWKNAWKREPL